MKVARLGWMGVKTRQFDEMNAFYRDVLNLDTLSMDDKSGRFKLGDGTEVHIYGPLDQDHEFFGGGPVVALEVEDFAIARARLLGASIEFVTRSHNAHRARYGSTSSRLTGTCTRSSALTLLPSPVRAPRPTARSPKCKARSD